MTSKDVKKTKILKLSKIILNHFRIISRGLVNTFMCLGMIIKRLRVILDNLVQSTLLQVGRRRALWAKTDL